MDRKKIGETIRYLRGERTHEEVCNAVGISVRALISYESGERIPRDDIKIRIAKYFGKTVQDIFFTQNRHT